MVKREGRRVGGMERGGEGGWERGRREIERGRKKRG